MDKKKRGALLSRALEGHAKKACCYISLRDLCMKNGVKVILRNWMSCF